MKCSNPHILDQNWIIAQEKWQSVIAEYLLCLFQFTPLSDGQFEYYETGERGGEIALQQKCKRHNFNARRWAIIHRFDNRFFGYRSSYFTSRRSKGTLPNFSRKCLGWGVYRHFSALILYITSIENVSCASKFQKGPYASRPNAYVCL